MSNLTFTLSIDENVLQKLERLAARKHKNVAALVHDYLVSLSETAETSEDRDRAEGEAKGSDRESEQGGQYRVNVLAKTDTLRMVTVDLAAEGCVPWHYHSNVSDMFFCLEQPIVIETRSPDGRVELRPGQTYRVARGQPHRVGCANAKPCTFALLQGVGVYDFVPL
jgi:quercetin dioxygenase-like cupin family protein